MIFAPIESATAVPPVNPQTQAEGSIGVLQPIVTTVPPQFAPVFPSSTPMATHAQGGFMIGFPNGWDPANTLLYLICCHFLYRQSLADTTRESYSEIQPIRSRI